MDNETIIESQHTKDLVLVANQYCTFVEKNHLFEQQDALDYLLKIIPLLYIKGVLIPEMEIEDNRAYNRFVTEEEYEINYLNFKDKFDKINYFEAFNTLNNEIETYDLAELTIDVYQDMKDFLILFQKNTFSAQETALWACRQNFYERWGRHISLLLPYLHQVLFPLQENIEEN